MSTESVRGCRARGTLWTDARRIAFLAYLLSSLTVPLGAAQNARQIAQNAFPAVALLVTDDASGQPLSLGSGFVVRSGYVVTNLHVIEGAARGYAKVLGHEQKYDISGVSAVDETHDLVILSVSGLVAPSLELGDSRNVAVGDEIYAIGNPKGLEGTFSQGIVSGIRNVNTDVLLQITAPISPGSSGGPVLNDKGKVIGVAAATFTGGQNLNFAIPSSYVESLLSRVGKDVAPLSSRGTTAQNRSILNQLGGKTVEGVVGETLSWESDVLQWGDYSFSVRNKLNQSVEDVYCLVIFMDETKTPIDVDVVRFKGTIPAGLAKRVKSKVDGSVQKLTRWLQFRVLDFRIVESQ